MVMESEGEIMIGDFDFEWLDLGSAPPWDSDHAPGIENGLGPGR
jgi:hypothetical protein